MIIISVGHFYDLQIEELWISFGFGNHYSQIPAVANSLLADNAKALVMFNVISGCDTVPSILCKWKKSTWSTWIVCPAVTGDFTTLSSQSEEVDPHNMTAINRFITIIITMDNRIPGRLMRRGSSSSTKGLRLLGAFLQPKLLSWKTWNKQCTTQVMCGHWLLCQLQICPVQIYEGGLHMTQGGSWCWCWNDDSLKRWIHFIVDL